MMLILVTSGGALGTTTYNVGDNAGWIIPSNGATTYSDWAKNLKFSVGDVLVFKFTTGAHTVASVKTKKDYDSCTAGNPLLLESNGPATVTLNSTGEHYFICTLHCTLGQKLTVNVSSAVKGSPPSSPPKSSPAPGSNPSSPSPPSSPPKSSPAPGSNSSSPSPAAAGTTPSPSSNPASPPPPSSATRATIFSSVLFLPFLLAALY
ncbi:unnamed protein product [Cuscuta campestris]|uniref:Phytocyanin domain-containing protein n=1 Tax=Cuscuta campestris TaxID=132261 RepID=A0A484LBJ2_9ASTE|nr:unnamed protein product [Cuscuta campestris]